jgi:pimeloyl-ACP methyl ester carboxylesterase
VTAVDVQRLVEEFFRIAKLPHDGFTKEFLNRCQSHTIKVHGKFYKYYQSGSGPTVLHVHGIRSNLGSMAAIADNLLAQDYQVVLFDAPAHGEALGTSTDPIEVREVIGAIAERFAELHAVIGHSLGGLWAVSAWNIGLRAKTLVTMSTPSTMRFLVDKFAEFYHLDGGQTEELARQIEGRLGEDVWTEFSPSEVVKALDAPGLIVHGAKDEYVSPSNAEELHSSWNRSRMEMIEGAGHLDLLASPKVASIISAHLQQVKGGG